MMLSSPEQYCQVGNNMPAAFVRPFSDLHKCSKVTVGQRFGPVPNLFKWLHRQIVNLERLHENSQLYIAEEHRDTVEIALKSNEQNVEIIYDGDEYYFDAVNNFNIASDGIKAWLSKDIEAKLVFKPAKTWINGCKTHYCLMCNLFSPHFNFIMLHMIFTCPKLANKINKQTLTMEIEKSVHNNSANNNTNNNKQQTNNNNNNRCGKKRGGFDIQSLLNARQDEEDDEESIDVETCEDSEILDVGIEDQILANKRQTLLNEYKQSAFKKLKTSLQPAPSSPNIPTDINMNIMPNLANLYSQFGPTLFANTFANFITNQSLSPFGAEPSPMMPFLHTNPQPTMKPSPGQVNTSPLPAKHHSPQLNPLCTSPSYSETSTQSLASSSLSPNISLPKLKPEAKAKREKLPQPSELPKWANPPEIGPENSSPSTSGSGLPPYYVPPTNNPVLSSIYLLSPSLTALSFQASNVCAHCQTAFRMTSDLVYHMRSHHKNVKERRVVGESSKKKRGEMLRCTICDETFRERHHLTRHMTSHQ